MIQKAIAIVTGSIFIAIGINFFVIPHHLLDGGIIGIGLIGKYAFGFIPGLTIIILSLPLYVIAYFYYKSYFYNGIHGLLVTSFFIDLLRPIAHYSSTPIFMSSLIGGLLIGIGVSILLTNNISTGGSDLLALILARLSSINVGVIILIFDSLVILTGSIVIPQTNILYSTVLVSMVGITTFLITGYFNPTKRSSY
ncbi:YitT family protein [Ornithinibacillus xuwenensis]|uniref:YitT family protein n=1 Tax=Ornithinibacillus xuwenensis TaxID=3144668 RepID=A0ABU9XJE9_9BACI